MRFSLAFGLIALIIHCEGLPTNILAGLSWPGDTSLAGALTRVKKNTDSIDGLEECKFVHNWQEEPGFINVLAFLDASWEYSHRQATMLKMLQGRLERSGITGIKFFVINSSEPEAAVNNLDVEDEKDAWDVAEPAQTQAFTEIQQTREALKKKIDPDITFVQDDDKLKIWEKLSATRDQVIVIDKCGRLSYRVIVPWSILHFPYVKAAILSTYKEQPCGGCEFETTTKAQETETQTEPFSELLPENLDIKQLKEIAAKTYNLDQTDNTVKKVYHGEQSHDIPENVIKLLNGSASVKKEKAKLDFENSTKHPPLLFTGDSNFDDSTVNGHSGHLNFTEDNGDDNQNFMTEDTLYVNESTTAKFDSDSSSTIINDLESVESTSVNSVEEESFNFTARSNLGNDQGADHSKESTESSSLENTSKYEDEYPLETTTTEESYVTDTSFDSEVFNTSAFFSSEEIDNQINKTVTESGETISGENSESSDYVMPIRIIMHAPHIHEHEEPMKKYEYLVLKFGKPDYHGHLESNNDKETEIEDDYNTGNENEEEVNYEDEIGSGEIKEENKQRYKHHGNHHGHKNRRKHSKSKHPKSIFDKDESPGFYGEDVEYWRVLGNGGYHGTLQIEQPTKNTEQGKEKYKQAEVYEAINVLETIEKNTTDVTGSKNNDAITEEEISRSHESSEKNQESPEEIDGNRGELTDEQRADHIMEGEKAKYLFVHYSKLIPWLDYVFEK